MGSGGAAEGAETTGSLRAFSRGTPRMIALKEEAWYRALTLQTFRAFECVVPIMRDRKKLSATRSLSAPSVRQRTSADETLAFWRVRLQGVALAHSKIVVCWHCVAVDWTEGVGYVGNVELAEFRWRVICGAGAP